MIGRGWLALAGVLILLGLGAGGGAWLAAGHYRPQLDAANQGLTVCRIAWGNLEALATEQGVKLGQLIQAGNERQARAEQAVKEAQALAQDDFAAANRLQQEHIGGDQCSAAMSVINQELGL